MENSYYYKHFVFLGVHPDRPLQKMHIIFNTSITTCLLFLAIYKCYLRADLEVMESFSAFFIMTVKYSALVFGRKIIKRILKAMENFRKINVSDDQVRYFVGHYKRVDQIYKCLFIFGILTHAVKPFIIKGSSMFNCYIPPQIPFLLFYGVEFYVVIVAASLFISFNIFVCYLIIFVVVQFRLLNLRIRDLNSIAVKSKNDLEVYSRDLQSIIKLQQFLIGCVDKLNELLSVPIALLMVTSVTMMCTIMYIITMHKGSISDEGRTIVISCAIVAEFFLVFGLPAQLLMIESAATTDMIYFECKWYLPNMRPLRHHFLIIIARSQKGVCIKAANYHVVNNQTILLILKTAYTFYTFLQRVTLVKNA